MRLLVLDPSRILPFLIRHELQAAVEIEEVDSLEEAERIVRHDPPDAAVVNVPPAHLAWSDFQNLCASRRPPVPVLYESCLHRTLGELGVRCGASATEESAGAAESSGSTASYSPGYCALLPMPASRRELHSALMELLEAVHSASETGVGLESVSPAALRES